MARFILGVALAAGLLLAGSARAEGLLIIANSTVEVAAPLPIGQIAAIYLLRVTTWPNGSHIVPVNREASSRTREEFTSRVLQENDTDLAIYWNELHFMGKLPPVVQESQQAMIAFIQNVPDSIGYISGSVAPPDVKVIAYVP